MSAIYFIDCAGVHVADGSAHASPTTLPIQVQRPHPTPARRALPAVSQAARLRFPLQRLEEGGANLRSLNPTEFTIAYT